MKVLLNILTHGDERVGLAVAREIKKLKIVKGEVHVHVANELAYRKKKRYIDQDLNRSFPGKPRGNHEQKLAAKILPLVKSADIVIDIHSTRSELRDSLIVTKLDAKTRSYIQAIRPKYALRMSATKKNALISAARVGIAFEYGKDKDPRTARTTILGIKRLLFHLGMIPHSTDKSTSKTLYFDVFSSVPKPKGAKLLLNINNYGLVKKGSPYAISGKQKIFARENFYSILFGNKNYEDIFGFAARKIS